MKFKLKWNSEIALIDLSIYPFFNCQECLDLSIQCPLTNVSKILYELNRLYEDKTVGQTITFGKDKVSLTRVNQTKRNVTVAR